MTLVAAYFKMSWVDENGTEAFPEYDSQFARRYVGAFSTTFKPIRELRLKTRVRLKINTFSPMHEGISCGKFTSRPLAKPGSG